MPSQLVVVHRKGGAKRSLETDIPGMPVWKTCLRQIGLGTAEQLHLSHISEAEILRGTEAYAFLLRVVCGLESPVIGETEVMGQFKDFALGLDEKHAAYLRKTLQSIFVHAKEIRHLHLTGLGSQSYGSLSRKYLKAYTSAGFVGSGQLVQEMLPWVNGKLKVSIVARNLSKAREISKDQDGVTLREISQKDALVGIEAAIIAAPISADDFHKISGRRQVGLKLVLDLRADADEDRIQLPGVEVVPLGQLFSELEGQKKKLEEVSNAAHKEVVRKTMEYAKRMECRPFGWDDLCA